jgi:hypothetical protein
MQIVLVELFLCHLRYTPVWVVIWVIQHIHLYIVQELVIFGEHYNDRDFKVF